MLLPRMARSQRKMTAGTLGGRSRLATPQYLRQRRVAMAPPPCRHCGCPTSVLALSSLPMPSGYTLDASFGFAMDGPGDWLYGVASGVSDWAIVRWPWPDLDDAEVVVQSPGLTAVVGYPCVVGTDIWWIEWAGPTADLNRRPIAGGSTDTVLTIGGLWGVVASGGKVYVASYDYPGGGIQVTGLIEIDPSTLASTFHEFSDGPDDGSVPHLLTGWYLTVADDGGIWAPIYNHPASGSLSLTRFDPATGTYLSAAVGDLDAMTAPDALGAVRGWDFSGSGRSIIVGPDMTITDDPCGSGNESHVWGGSFWSGDWSIVGFHSRDNAVSAVACGPC